MIIHIQVNIHKVEYFDVNTHNIAHPQYPISLNSIYFAVLVYGHGYVIWQ